MLRTALAALVVVTNSSIALGALPVKGRADLLDLVLAAQETNLTQFPEGRLRAKVHTELGSRITDLTTVMIWDGGKTFWDYEYTQTDRRDDTRVEKQARQIEVGKTLYYYDANVQLAQRYAESNVTYLLGLKLRPDQLWFNFDGLALWKDWLSPTHPRWAAPTSHHYFKVRQEDQDRIVVERYFRDNGGLRVEVSLQNGGNIVSYDCFGEMNIWWRGSYEWAQLPDGRWYLKRGNFQRSANGDPDKPDKRLSVEILEFDPAPKIEPKQFEFVSLRVDPGAMVEEIAPDGTTEKSYRFGPQEETLNQKLLDQLSEKLRREGFASPDRR